MLSKCCCKRALELRRFAAVLEGAVQTVPRLYAADTAAATYVPHQGLTAVYGDQYEGFPHLLTEALDILSLVRNFQTRLTLDLQEQ